MRSPFLLSAAVLAAAPAAAFAPAGPCAVRGAHTRTCAAARAPAAAPRMYAEAEPAAAEATGLPRRVFFQDVLGGSAALTIGSLGLEVPQARADGLPEVSGPAPPFSLPSNAGRDVCLSDLAGKWSVLYFYPGDTSGCAIEAQNFERGAAALRDLGAEIYGVSASGSAKNLALGTKHGLSFSLLSDSGGRVSEAYGSAHTVPFLGTFSERQTYLIDPAGKLRWVFTDVASRLDKHVDEVKSKLMELQA
jgi:peroxiredoxin Q/BCP